MSAHLSARPGVAADAPSVVHRLLVDADAHPNILLRVLEPFAIQDILPQTARVDTDAAGMRFDIAFVADRAAAERLCARIGAMVPVRQARLETSYLDLAHPAPVTVAA